MGIIKRFSEWIGLKENLHRDYRRLKEKIGELEENEAERVKDLYLGLHSISVKNRPPAVFSRSRG